MNRYEFSDGKSNKFWQIEQQGSALHISWGKIGTNGQSQVKAFDTEAKAEAAKTKLVAEKTGKGYVPTGDAPMAAAATPKVASPKSAAMPVASQPPRTSTQAANCADAVTHASAPAREAGEAASADAGGAAGPACASGSAAPNAHAHAIAASIDAPREAIEAWLTQRRQTPSVDERALQAWPRVLQLVQAAGQGEARGSLTPTQVQRGAQVDDDAMHLIDTWVMESGLSYSLGFSGLRYISKDDRATAASALAAAQHSESALLAQGAQAREQAWAPLAEGEPAVAWPARMGQRLVVSGAGAWPLRSDGPHPSPSKHSATEAWYLLRKSQPERFDASKSEPSLVPDIDRLAQRLDTEPKPVPDEGSDRVLLALCVHQRYHLKASAPLIVAYLVQAHGLPKLMQMLAQVSQWSLDYDYVNQGRKWSLQLASAEQAHLFHRPADDLFGLLRSWLLVADEAQWQATVGAAMAVLPEVAESQRAWFSLLMPESPELAHAVLDSYANKLPASALWLLVGLPMGDAVRRVVATIKPDVNDHGSLYNTPALLGPVLHKLGSEALGLLVAGVGHASIAAQVAATNSPDAVVALAKQAAVSKENQSRLRLALARWPLAGVIGLARVCAQGGKDLPLLLPLLRQTMGVLGPALAMAPAWLPPAAREVLATQLAKGGRDGEQAPPEALPAVLRNPPWQQAKKRLAVKAMALAPLAVDVASSGEQPPLSKWEEQHLRDALAQSKNDALALAEELRINTYWNQKKSKRQYVEAMAVAIRQRSAPALVEAWTAGLNEEYVKKEGHYYWPALDGLACLALPDDLGLALWNAKAGTVDGTRNHEEVMAHWGVAALPGLLTLIRANPVGMMGVTQHWGSTDLAPMAARAAFKLKTLRKEGLRWLLRWPEHAIGGLIAPALGKAGEARDVAAKALRFLSGKGHHDSLMRMAARYDDPHVAQAVQAVLDEDPLDLHPSKIPSLPALWQPQHWARPALRSGEGVLGDAAMQALGEMLMFPRNDGLYEGLPQALAACEPDSLAEFGWEMFSAWLADGAPSKDNWMLSSLAVLGNDEAARRLTPLIRAWPGESAHARAVAGLDVLEGIGTDTALMLLNGIAQKVKFKGLQDKAGEKIEAIAQARGLSTEELEDRLAPDLGLDERGALVLDFGARQFQVGFDEALKPWVRDFTGGVAGARLKDLPKPLKTDDAELAKAATERYKLLKKDAKTIAAQQIQRLETAMCQQRRWSAENFRDFIAEHPLVRHIAQRLIWGVYAVDGQRSADETGDTGEASGVSPSPEDAAEVVYPNFGGQLLACFRLCEDASLSTADDEVFEMPASAGEGRAVRVGIPHALDLPVSDAQAFGQLFADYELLQPFAQVGRDTHALTEAQVALKDLDRWKGRKVPTGRILGLVNKAWRKGDAQDGGGIWYFNKPLADGRVIEMSFEPGIIVGMVDEEPEQTIGTLTLGSTSRWGGISQEDQQVWRTLDAIDISELIRDMEALCAP